MRWMGRDQNWSLPILRFPCNKKNVVTGRNSIFFFFNILILSYSDIPNHVSDKKTDIQLLLKFVTKCFILFLIVTSSIFSQISKLNFDYGWCFDMFHYPTFLVHQNGCTDLRYRWVLLKILKISKSLRKWLEGKCFRNTEPYPGILT